MKVIVIANQKGGVGKTTVTTQLGTALSASGPAPGFGISR